MADRKGCLNIPKYNPSPPLCSLPTIPPPPIYCSESNSVCLRFCLGKYNQSFSHWQIPIICNFMDYKPIWIQKNPLNVCEQLPQWANYDFYFFFIFNLLSWNPGDRFCFSTRNRAQKMTKKKSEWEINNGRYKRRLRDKRGLSDAEVLTQSSSRSINLPKTSRALPTAPSAVIYLSTQCHFSSHARHDKSKQGFHFQTE